MTPVRTTTSHTLPGGHVASVSTRPNGRVATIHANGLAINHGVRGGRVIVSEHNGRTIVSEGHHGGYVQRPYLNRGGRSYYQRTYYRNGHAYSRAYRGYEYHGGHYYGYVPDHYYHPRYYGWAYHPWSRPVYYSPAAWGWAGSPWYGAYGGFFTPYPVYATASLWLTDYLIASNLQAAYQAGVQAGAAGAGGQPPAAGNQAPDSGNPEASTQQTPLSPEVKQAIADEVQRQIAAEQAAAANPQGGNPQGDNPQAANPQGDTTQATNTPPAPGPDQVPDALNPAERVFVVSSSIDVTPAGGQECGLTAGDVLMRLSDTPDDNQNVTASVQSSKAGDCAAGQTVAVSVQDLQEMHNHFREQIDSGLKTLADNSGKNGLPSAPDTGTQPGEVPAPAPDAGAADQLQAQEQQADQVETQVQQSN
jgi:hypothetical protein